MYLSPEQRTQMAFALLVMWLPEEKKKNKTNGSRRIEIRGRLQCRAKQMSDHQCQIAVFRYRKAIGCVPSFSQLTAHSRTMSFAWSSEDGKRENPSLRHLFESCDCLPPLFFSVASSEANKKFGTESGTVACRVPPFRPFYRNVSISSVTLRAAAVFRYGWRNT